MRISKPCLSVRLSGKKITQVLDKCFFLRNVPNFALKMHYTSDLQKLLFVRCAYTCIHSCIYTAYHNLLAFEQVLRNSRMQLLLLHLWGHEELASASCMETLFSQLSMHGSLASLSQLHWFVSIAVHGPIALVCVHSSPWPNCTGLCP